MNYVRYGIFVSDRTCMSALNSWKNLITLKFAHFHTEGIIKPKHLILILRNLIIPVHISFLYFYLGCWCWFSATNIKWWIHRPADNSKNLELFYFLAKYVLTLLNSMKICTVKLRKYAHGIGYSLRFILEASEKCVVRKSNDNKSHQIYE